MIIVEYGHYYKIVINLPSHIKPIPITANFGWGDIALFPNTVPAQFSKFYWSSLVSVIDYSNMPKDSLIRLVKSIR